MKIAFTGNVFPFFQGMYYGGERILYYLAKELSQRGHELYVFSVKGTEVPFAKDFIEIESLLNERDNYFESIKRYSLENKVQFDLFQCNYFGKGDPDMFDLFPYIELTWNRWCHASFEFGLRPFNVVSYSRVLQQDFRDIGIETTMIHYGIPKLLYQFEPEPEDYVVWIGKIEGGKAPKLAIQLSLAAGLKIVMIGPPYNLGCFRDQILPYLDNERVFWVRGANDFQKQKIISKAKAFISSNDNSWKEHFGIVNIEALAMGVPIIAFNRIGQDCAVKVDRIVEDEKHGFILNYENSEAEQYILDTGVPLIQQIDSINREDCRKHFEKNFTVELMADRFEYMYQFVRTGSKLDSLNIPF